MVDEGGNFSATMIFLSILSLFSALSVNTLLAAVGTVAGQEDVILLDEPAPGRHGHKEHLNMDEALLIVQDTLDQGVEVYVQYSECWKCPLLSAGNASFNKNLSFVRQTQFSTIVAITAVGNKSNIFCMKTCPLVEYGNYSLWVSKENNGYKCTLAAVDMPPDTFIPIYVAIGVFLGMVAFWALLKFLYRKNVFTRFMIWMPEERLINSDLGTPEPSEMSDEIEQLPVVKPRLRSLDTFRGLSLVIMIFVNYKGGYYWFFHHSTWNGLTVADLVFPWFTFIMGTSIALAFKNALRKNISRKKIAWKVVKRTFILFTLGLMISNDGSHGYVNVQDTLRIPGVLQRLAVTYFVVAMMEAFYAQPHDYHEHRWWSPVRDVLPFWAEWLISLSLVAVHLGLTFLLPVPGCPTGYLGPGGLHENRAHENCTGGAAGYIDRWVFGDNHMYGHPTCKVLYETTVPYDPEGILGTLTSIFICFLGLQAGKIIVTYTDWASRVKRWLIWGLITGLIAGTLCKFSQNDGWIPVNKNFWSLSFVLGLASMAYITLALFYILIDVTRIWSGAPFVYPGMNSILVYMCHEVFQYYFPVQFKVPHTHACLLPLNLYGAALWTIMAAILYYKKIFVAI